MLKVGFHAHTSLDPLDRISYTTRELIDRASALGYGAIAVTCHNHYFDPAADAAYARERGITLLPGIERTVDGRHVLLINFPAACADVRSFDDIARLKSAHPRGLVVAPHAFYPTPSALRGWMNRHAKIFDAVEVSAFFTRHLDFNHRARTWARAHGLPLVGNCDVHILSVGTTYTLVDAPPDADAICDAIRAGRTEVRATPLGLFQVGWLLVRKLALGVEGRLRPRRAG